METIEIKEFEDRFEKGKYINNSIYTMLYKDNLAISSPLNVDKVGLWRETINVFNEHGINIVYIYYL